MNISRYNNQSTNNDIEMINDTTSTNMSTDCVISSDDGHEDENDDNNHDDDDENFERQKVKRVEEVKEDVEIHNDNHNNNSNSNNNNNHNINNDIMLYNSESSMMSFPSSSMDHGQLMFVSGDNDDHASLFVNTQTEDDNDEEENDDEDNYHRRRQNSSSQTNTSYVNNTKTNAHSNSHANATPTSVRVFQRLSKSASKLLSQDRQTLSEILRDMAVVDTAIVGETTQDGIGAGIGGIGGIGGVGTTTMSTTATTNNNKQQAPLLSLQQQQQKQQWEDKWMKQKQKYESQIQTLQCEIDRLTKQLNDRHHDYLEDNDGRRTNIMSNIQMINDTCDFEESFTSCPLNNKKNNNKDNNEAYVAELTPDQISRYSRQLLLNDGFGVKGQQKLLSSSVLVIGAGGIGSTVLLYLAASGVGHIIVVDFDVVEKSNLHRQVIHCEDNVGMNKAASACMAMKKLNPSIQCTPIQDVFTYDNALDIISKYKADCVVDACDNPQTRYVCNDVCILSKIPLISGSAMGTEGQLTVYGFNNSACYRCLYPKVNQSEGCKSCSDNGVLGTVPGLIGILQATETLKVLTGVGKPMCEKLLMYDSMSSTFMSVKKPSSRKECIVCGNRENLMNLNDCKDLSTDIRGPQSKNINASLPQVKNTISSKNMNISCQEYEQIRKNKIPHILLDVRVERQFEMCSLPGALNFELGKISDNMNKIKELCDDGKAIYCICRRGIASVEATKLISQSTGLPVQNVIGGYNAWQKEVDSSFPTY